MCITWVWIDGSVLCPKKKLQVFVREPEEDTNVHPPEKVTRTHVIMETL